MNSATKAKKADWKDPCQAILTDGVTPCPYGALPDKKYCGKHDEKWTKIDEERAKKAVKEALNLQLMAAPKPYIGPKITIISQYKSDQLNIIKNIDRADPKNSNLLVVKFPSAFRFIDFDKNKDFNIDYTKITYACSTIKMWWLCLINSAHGVFMPPSSKTSKCKVIDGENILNGCRECSYDAQRIHNKEEADNVRNSKRSEKGLIAIENGIATELFMKDFLIASGKYKRIEKIGGMNGDSDVIVTFADDSFVYVQVKTMTRIKRDEGTNSFSVKLIDEYPPNMLIVMVDNSRNYFALEFSGKITVKSLSLAYNGTSKYKHFMYTDKNLFAQKLHELIPFSSKVLRMDAKTQKEKESLERFAQKCAENGILYERNSVSSTPIDGFVNGYSFQAKSKQFNTKHGKMYEFNFAKSAGKLDGSPLKKPYETGDFKCLVFEAAGTRDGTKDYRGNFCIVPDYELENRAAFKNSENEGRKALSICPPDYKGDHWSKPYWNNWDVIRNLK